MSGSPDPDNWFASIEEDPEPSPPAPRGRTWLRKLPWRFTMMLVWALIGFQIYGISAVDGPDRTLNRRLPSIAGPSAQSREEPVFARLAREFLATTLHQRHPGLRVYCWDEQDWIHVLAESVVYDGGTSLDVAGMASRGQRIDLDPVICADLAALKYRPEKVGNDRRAVEASLSDFTHEAVHISGVHNEAVTQCYAIQLADQMGSLFGLDKALHGQMGKFLWKAYLHEDIGPEYFTNACHNGSRLDLHPHSDRWP